MKSYALAAWALTLLAGQESAKVDNAEYRRWSRFKVGSVVKFKITTNAEGQIDDELAVSLKSLDNDQAVLVRTFGGVVGGRKRVTSAERNVPSKVIKGQDAEGRAAKEVGTGEQFIRLLGKMTKCKWVEIEYTVMNGPDEIKMREKTWLHDSLVGGIARFEVKRVTSGVTTTYDASESTPAK